MQASDTAYDAASETGAQDTRAAASARLTAWATHAGDAPGIPRHSGLGPVPLSFAQERLWFFDQLHPASALYNMPFAMRIRAPLSADVLRRTVAEIIGRHETLRTHFAMDAGRPVQHIAETVPTPFDTIDLRSLAPAAREARAQELAAFEAETPFDLARAPLLRVRLVLLDTNDQLLLLTLHHIISDGWSMGVLYRELGQIYAAFEQGRPSPLAPLPIQYADFAVWQRDKLSGDTLQGLLDFWRGQLDGAPPILELPSDRPRPAAQSYRGGIHSFTIDAGTGAALRALARDMGATPFMVLLAAVNLLLARYSGQDDIVVGTPIANRTQVEQEPLIGFFVNTLVIRTRIGPKPSFRDLVAQTRETLLAAYAHQDLPFERLVEELQPQRSLSHNPLFQVMVALQIDGEATVITASPQDAAPPPPDTPRNGMARFDLALAMAESGQGFSAAFEFCRDLFDDETIAAMAERFTTLLHAAIEHPDRPVHLLSLLSAAQQHRLIHDWNGAYHPYSPDLSFPDLVFAIAKAQGAALAVDDGVVQLDYATLTHRAATLAAVLAARGIGLEDRVGVCLGAKADLVTAFLGVLVAGATWVPLSSSLPCARLTMLAEDAGLALVIGDPEEGHDWLPDGVDFVDIRAAHTGSQTPHIPVPLHPATSAYIIYTSGSTGAPKGVIVPHSALARVAFNQRQLLGIVPSDRVLMFASISFDASVFEMVMALSTGACLHLAPQEARTPGVALARLLRDRRITAAVLPPAACAVTLEEDLEHLTMVMTAGEAIEPAVARRWCRGRRYFNGYGPTESGIWASTGTYDPEGDAVPIGRPCINIRLYVLDRHGQPVPPGIDGELHIGGEGLALGYAGQPDLTARSFIADPFSSRPGARMYRTGDIVRMRRDGELEFIGRIDGQLKIRGFRIEPGEIEAALGEMAEVADAAVIASGTGASRRLEAHLVAAEGQSVDMEAVRRALRRTLPEYMVPSAIHLQDRLPLTPNGKVDRAALAASVPRRWTASRPRTKLETQIAAIWAELLETDEIPADDGFFEIGGHSLLAARLVMRLRDRFGVEFPLRAVFEVPTISGQADLIERAGHSGDAAGARPVIEDLSQAFAKGDGSAALLLQLADPKGNTMTFDPGMIERLTAEEKRRLLIQLLGEPQAPRDGPDTSRQPVEAGPVPLSFAQERLWFFDQLHPASALYNMPFAMRIRAPLSADVLRRTVAEIIGRHETLRTHFAMDAGRPVQHIAETVPTPFDTIDLRSLAPAAREARAQELAAFEAETPFDLARAPLLRVRLVLLDTNDQLLLLTLHHIISDGWSMGVLYRELGQIYAAFEQGRPSPLAPLPIQYADFAVWQRDKLSGDTLQGLLDFWRGQLDGAPPILELPSDRPRPAAQSYRGGIHSFTIDAGTGAALRALARDMGATPFMVLLAAVNLLLARYSGQDDIVVGTPIANRTQVEQEPLIGFFVNTLVIRTRIGPKPSFRDLVAQTRETLLAAYAHQDLPFERLVEELQPQRSLSHNPLFQVMVLFQAATGKQVEDTSPAQDVRPPEMLTGTSKFDLTLALAETNGGFSCAVEFNSDLFDARTISVLARHFVSLLRAACAAPDRPARTINMIEAPERARLLEGFGEPGLVPATPARQTKTIDQIVTERAAEEPDRPALDFSDGQLSYGDLDAQSNRLARELRARQIGPGARVALLINRSAALVVAMLAVWKAGAAFVLLDAAGPAGRLAAMLDDAGVTLVVGSATDIELPAGIARFDPVQQSDTIGMRSRRPLTAGARPGDLAQIIFTSGSSGAPKGVMLEHRQFLWFLDAMESADIVPADRVGQCVNPAFDVMAFECWCALTKGACLVGIPRDDLLVPDTLAATLAERRVSVLYQTAALFNQTAAHRPDAYHGVRMLFVGGDVVEPAKVRAAMLASRIPVFKHTYGPTETTIFCSIQTLTAPPLPGEILSLAPALPGAALFVVDEAGQLAPEGTPGELWIGGACLARGYVGRPDLTAERFVPDPFSARPGGRLYRSGDIVRLRSDGRLEFLGRRDDQVKIRGYRVELAEIDMTIRRFPGVQDSVTLCRGTGLKQRLVTYVVAEESTIPDLEALRLHCKQALPDYMVPFDFIALPALPLTSNGKLDRAALPAPDLTLQDAVRAYDPPRTKSEREIAEIWRHVLGIPQVGRHDNFFDIGGHSLLATQVITRVREKLGADIALRGIFEAPTLAELSVLTDRARAEDTGDPGQSEPALIRVSRAAYRVQAGTAGGEGEGE